MFRVWGCGVVELNPLILPVIITGMSPSPDPGSIPTIIDVLPQPHSSLPHEVFLDQGNWGVITAK